MTEVTIDFLEENILKANAKNQNETLLISVSFSRLFNSVTPIIPTHKYISLLSVYINIYFCMYVNMHTYIS